MRLLLLSLVLAVGLCAEEFVRLDLPLPKPFGVRYQPTKPPLNSQSPISNSFEELAKIYANSSVEFEHLKAVTLAMMMLESGRGSSDLARKHNNFGGLKYRPEMAKYAKKVRYNASDGIDFYCEFESPEAFIKGFWAVLDRSPYAGWRTKARTQRAFLEFIAPIYCPFNSDYTASVMRLVPEAEALLEMGKMEGGYRVAIARE